jgi:hypothetical protein
MLTKFDASQCSGDYQVISLEHISVCCENTDGKRYIVNIKCSVVL